MPLKSCSLLRNTEKWQIWMRIWHLVIPPSPTVYLPPRAKINLIGVSATGTATGGDLSFFPFYVKSTAKGLPWPKCSLLPLQITCYHALVTWVLHTHHSGLTQLPQNWTRGGTIKKKKKKVHLRKRRMLLSPNYQVSFYIQHTNKAFELFMLDQSKLLVSKICWFRPTPNWSVCPQGALFPSLLPHQGTLNKLPR